MNLNARMKELGSGGFFFAASLFAGLLNYIFQVLASRQLSAENFSALNGWFADLAIFFLIGGLLQYGSNFAPAPRKSLRFAVLFINVIALVLLGLWFTQSSNGVLTVPRALIVITIACISGWMMGQVQIRLAFFVISIANLLIATSKVVFTWAPVGTPEMLDRYALALFISYLPALWLASGYLWSAPDAEDGSVEKNPAWMPAFILAAATAIVPQFDLVVMHHSLSQDAFSEFVKASMFYRAIYFVLFILAQWLLPRQIRKSGNVFVTGFPLLVAGTFAISIALTIASPWISTTFLKWSVAPSPLLVFLSCIHMSALALLFLAMQKACATGKPRLAATMLVIMGVEAGIQWIVHLDAFTYLYAMIAVQSVAVIYAWRKSLL